MSHELAEVLGFETCIKVGRMLPSAEEASCIFPSRMKLGRQGLRGRSERWKRRLAQLLPVPQSTKGG